MIEHIYAIYDKAAQIHLKPLLVSRNDVAPTRDFAEAIHNENSIFNKHAVDFELHHIGTINLETGHIENHDNRTVATAIELLLLDKPTS